MQPDQFLDERHAPANGSGFALAVTIDCQCARGSHCVITADRLNGHWVTSFTHEFSVDGFLLLPPHPKAKTHA